MTLNIESKKTAQHSVHPTGGSLRVFKQFARLEVDSVKVALSRLTHQAANASRWAEGTRRN